MMSTYKAPPGRPQAVPPKLFDDPEPTEMGPDGMLRPVRLPDEKSYQYANRVRHWRTKNIPGYRDRLAQNMSEGHISANTKARNRLARECNKLNLTETRGRWYTLDMIVRDTGRTAAGAKAFVQDNAVAKAADGMARRYLIPTDKLKRLYKETDATPFEVAPPPVPASPPPLGREVRVRRIEVTTDQLEAFLIVTRNLKNPRFAWTSSGVVITIEEEG